MGDYPLASVDAMPLPRAHPVPGGCPMLVFTSGTLSIASASTYHIRLVYYAQCPNGPSPPIAIDQWGGYTLAGDSMVLAPPVSETTLGPSFAGHVLADGIELHFSGQFAAQWADPVLYWSPRTTAPAP